jgi:predicted metal-binding membrane protein
VLIAGTVALLATLGWAYLLVGMSTNAMQPPLGALIVMWWLMMLAMMLPSATPAVALYARVRQASSDTAITQSWVFLSGYLAVWLLFSIGAALAQWLVADASMAIRSRAAQNAVLIVAGLYQLSPLKTACVSQCRSPGQFISRHWRPGWGGAVRLGVMHGAFCVGCCWMLMALLLVGGVMNMLWVVGLTVFIAAEKLLPAHMLLQKVSGVALILWGFWRLLE